jgi:putative transposase
MRWRGLHLEEGVPLSRVAAAQRLPLRTAQAWLRRYRQHGLAGLARAPRADRGRRRLVPDLQRLVEGLALRTPPPSAAAVQRQVAAVARRQGWPVPSYSTVYAVMRHLDPALVTLAHDGAKAYREAFDLLYRREASCPNALWQADHTQLDLWLHDERGRPAKPWLTVILDDYSCAVAGFGLSFRAPSALQTALVLRQAIGRKAEPGWSVCGIPDVFYTDHGSDFTSRHLEQVAADLHLQLVFSQAGVPRGRGKIERFFETVTQLFLSAQPGYAPPGSPQVAPILTLAGLTSRFYAFVLDDYHHRAHSETRQGPMARWAAGGFLPRLPESPEQLDLLLLTVAKPRVVHQDGIHFLGFRYLDLTLAAYVGEPVTIRYDPRDVAEIRVFHRDTFLCRAVCQELAGQTIGLHDIVQARSQRRRQLRGRLADRAAVVELLLAVHQPVPAPAPPGPPPEAGPRLKRYADE